MFTATERERVQRRLVEIAESDPRIVAGALVGSLAAGQEDEWSDIDVTFGVDESFAVADVLDDWSRTMSDEFKAVALLDLTVRGKTYRVFLLDDWLQADLSFAPASVRQGGPRFKLLFGAHTMDDAPPPSPHDVFGWGVVYARAARASIDRGKWWQAEYSLAPCAIARSRWRAYTGRYKQETAGDSTICPPPLSPSSTTPSCGHWIAGNFFAHSTVGSTACSVRRTMFEMSLKGWNLNCGSY